MNTYLILYPSIWNGRSVLFNTDHLSHIFNARVAGHSIIIGQLVFITYSTTYTFSCYFPQHKTKCIHVTTLVCIKVPHLHIVFKKLRRHVTLCTNSVAMRNINCVSQRTMANSKTQITYATCPYTKRTILFTI